jgi:hypothetical protein
VYADVVLALTPGIVVVFLIILVALVPFATVQGGLWLALALSLGRGGRDRRALAVGAGTALALVAVASGVVPGVGSLAAAAVVVAVAIPGVLYAVHRYERVAAGLVEE